MIKQLPAFILSLTLLFPFQASATDTTAAFVQKMERRRGYWASFQGYLQMTFSNAQGKSASCQAEIYYNRLEEEIILKGFTSLRELLFIFQTNDRYFRLYLPRQKTEFHGTIFELEDSPDIHSHLKALDLYRALKPGLMREERTSLVEEKNGLSLLKTESVSGQQRQVWLNAQGDVLKEEFGAGGELKSVIEKSDFQKISAGAREPFYYPHRIQIQTAGESGSQITELDFESVEFGVEYKTKFPEMTVLENAHRYEINTSPTFSEELL